MSNLLRRLLVLSKKMTNLLGFLTLAEHSEASRQKIKIYTFDAKLRFAIMVINFSKSKESLDSYK